MTDYPPHKSFTTTNFKHFIKLCEIIQTIIMRLYVGRPRHLSIGRFVHAIHERHSNRREGKPLRAGSMTRRCTNHFRFWTLVPFSTQPPYILASPSIPVTKCRTNDSTPKKAIISRGNKL